LRGHATGNAGPDTAAERTGMLDLSSWPEGMRVIVRKERPQPAQLRFTDVGGHRFTCCGCSPPPAGSSPAAAGSGSASPPGGH
jgi:hypothetical protein